MNREDFINTLEYLDIKLPSFISDEDDLMRAKMLLSELIDIMFYAEDDEDSGDEICVKN